MTRRRYPAIDVHNVYVRLDGRRYRVARSSAGRVMVVALRVGERGERAMDIDGPRAREVLAELERQP